MKKLLALLLCVAMLATLAACGDTPSEEDVRGEQSVVETPTNEDASTNEGTNPTSAPSANKEFGLGQIAGLNYENKFIGIGCNLDSNWTFSTEEEILAKNNLGTDLLDKDLADALKNATIVYDMEAVHANGTDNMNVNLQKSTEAAVAAVNLNDAYQAGQTMLKQSLESMGCTNIVSTITTATLGGKSIPVMKTSASISGMSMYIMSVMIKCDSGYIANLSLGTFMTDGTDDLLAKFYWVE